MAKAFFRFTNANGSPATGLVDAYAFYRTVSTTSLPLSFSELGDGVYSATYSDSLAEAATGVAVVCAPVGSGGAAGITPAIGVESAGDVVWVACTYEGASEANLAIASSANLDVWTDLAGDAVLPKPTLTQVGDSYFYFTLSPDDIAQGRVWSVSALDGAIPLFVNPPGGVIEAVAAGGSAIVPGTLAEVDTVTGGTGTSTTITLSPTDYPTGLLPLLIGAELNFYTGDTLHNVTGPATLVSVDDVTRTLTLSFPAEVIFADEISGGDSVRFGSLSGGAPDETAPVVTVVSPPVSEDLAPEMPIAFTVSDAGTLGSVVVMASFPSRNIWEVIWDGASFAPNYVDRSEVTSGPSLLTFSVQRTPGWPESPTLKVFAADTSGNEAS